MGSTGADSSCARPANASRSFTLSTLLTLFLLLLLLLLPVLTAAAASSSGAPVLRGLPLVFGAVDVLELARVACAGCGCVGLEVWAV